MVNSVVVGGYQTKFGELWDQGLSDLLMEASRGAIADAGVEPGDIDMVFVGNKLSGKLSGQDHLGALTAEALGLLVPTIRVEAACASGGVAVHQGVMAIEAGMAECVLVVGVEKMTDVTSSEISAALMGAAGEVERRAGLTFVGLYALMARAYLDKFGAEERDLANVAVKNHWHGTLNDRAQFRFRVTADQVLASLPVADPLKLLDCSPITDGAAAVVLTSKRFAKRKKCRPVRVLGSALGSECLSLEKRKDLTEIGSTRQAALAAYRQAGVEPADVDVVEVHDCFTVAEILAVEDLGFYPKGEGFVAERNGEVKLGGRRPVNVSGGLKACGHPVGATGVKQVVEVMRQLRGEMNGRAVKGARIGLTHNVGGTGGTAVVHILGK